MRGRGESYCDIIERLQPVIFELERTTKPVIVVSHQAVLRCLISYFIDTAKEKIPFALFVRRNRMMRSGIRSCRSM